MPLPQPIVRILGAVARRVRLQRALHTAGLFLIVGAGLAAFGVALMKTGQLNPEWTNPLLMACASLPVLGGVVGFFRRVKPLLPAQLADRRYNLASRLANALEFAKEPEPTPFMQAAMADAAAQTAPLSAKEVLPIRLSADWVYGAVLAACAAALFYVQVQNRRPLIPPEPLDPMLIDEDSLDGFESDLETLLQDQEAADDVRQVARDLNQVLEDMADQRADRAEAIRRIAELEEALANGNRLDTEALEEQLEEVGRELSPANLAEAASEALQEHNAAEAAEALESLAERLEMEPPSERELDALREALQDAAEDELGERLDEIREEQEELEESLLRREQENQDDMSPQEERLLRRQRRQLERLQRERQEVENQRRQLERLRREMENAAEALNRDAREQSQMSEQMRRLAEELNRTAREQMSEEQRQQLEQQMEQLREMIRRAQQGHQQGQNGQDGQNGQQGQGQGRGERLRRFTLSAGGQGGTRVVMPGQGQQGQGQGQQGQQGQGQQGQGQGQQGQGQGQGQQGQGQGQGGQGQGQGQTGQGGQGQGQGQGGQGDTMVLNPNGGGGDANAILEIPGMNGQQQGGGQGDGGGQGGSGAGNQHNPITLDDATSLDAGHENTRVQGEHGDGPSRSEVIQGAANRGFASQPYEDVYADYEGHAEEVLERDEIPQGYRFYVRRYFQLIRPRDGAPADSATSPASEVTASSDSQ